MQTYQYPMAFFLLVVTNCCVLAQQPNPDEPLSRQVESRPKGQTLGPAKGGGIPAAENQTEDKGQIEGDAAAARRTLEKGEALPAGNQVDAVEVEQLEIELRDVGEEIEVAKQAVTPVRAKELGVTQDELLQHVTLLEDLQNVIQRRITARKRLEEIQQTITGLEKQIRDSEQVKLETKPPYELIVLDKLRDELSTVRREQEARASSLETAKALRDRAEEQLQDARQKRRQIRDGLNGVAGDTPQPLRQWQIASAELSEKIAEHELRLAETRVELAQLENRSSQLRIELLKAKIAYVDRNVTFTRKELEKHLADFDSQRNQLEGELSSLRRTDQANQARLAESREALQSARGEEQIRRRTDALAAREASAQGSSRAVQLLEEQIHDVAELKSLWKRRFALTQDPSEEDLTEWQRATESTLDDMSRRRQELEQRLKSLRTKRLDIENRLSSWEPAMGDKSEVESQLNAVQDRETQETRGLASLLKLEGLAQRVAEDVQEQRQLDSWWKYWSRFLHTAKYYWRFELFEFRDNAFRLGALIRAAVVFCVVMIVVWVGRGAIRRTLVRHLRAHAEASQTVLDDALLAIVRRTQRIFVILVAAYLALITLPLSGSMVGILNSIAIIVLTTQVAIWADAALGGMIDKTRKRQLEEDPSAASAFGLMGFFSRVAVWSAALLLVLTNLGYEIGPLLAGLGVGGVAVAFALQSILGDIFCSIAIVLDKPFIIGDFIIVGDLMGAVEHIGIKTTRLRSLSGEQIVFSNADLIGSRVRNYKRMYERRIVFTFGVVYEIPVEKLEQIPVTVRTIIESLEHTRFDRAHFKEYGDFSLNFEVVYYVTTPDYNLYMDIQQAINLRLFREFQAAQIAFAYPTREIIVRPNGEGKVHMQPHPAPAKESHGIERPPQ